MTIASFCCHAKSLQAKSDISWQEDRPARSRMTGKAKSRSFSRAVLNSNLRTSGNLGDRNSSYVQCLLTAKFGMYWHGSDGSTWPSSNSITSPTFTLSPAPNTTPVLPSHVSAKAAKPVA